MSHFERKKDGPLQRSARNLKKNYAQGFSVGYGSALG